MIAQELYPLSLLLEYVVLSLGSFPA